MAAANLTGHLLREIVVRGSRGGPLAQLADQLNHDVTHLQGRRMKAVLGQLAGEVQGALAHIGSTHAVTAAPAALAQLPAATAGCTGRDDELAVLERLLDPAGEPACQRNDLDHHCDTGTCDGHDQQDTHGD